MRACPHIHMCVLMESSRKKIFHCLCPQKRSHQMTPSTTSYQFYLHKGIKEICWLLLLKFICNFTKIINPEGLLVKICKFFLRGSPFHSYAEGSLWGNAKRVGGKGRKSFDKRVNRVFSNGDKGRKTSGYGIFYELYANQTPRATCLH